MQVASFRAQEICPLRLKQAFTPLELEHRPTVITAAAAHYLNRRPQTLRGWACNENGPLCPVRINGRLAWQVAELRRILGVSQ
jgi:hypothetical protein